MKVGFFQFCPEHLRPDTNLEHVTRALTGIDCDLVVLPELCLTGYMFQSRKELATYAEPVPDGPSCQTLARFCREQELNLVIGLVERAGDRIFNSAVLITRHGNCHTYRKTHLFLDEKDIFDPGDKPFPVFDIDGVRVGMLVCFDYFAPETAKALTLNGAQLICHPSNLVLDYAQWMTLTRAAENRVFWIIANRTGTETLGTKAMTFTGCSQFVGPTGKLLYRAGTDTEELHIIEIDPAAADDKNVTPRNHLIADRRTDLYST